MTRSETDAPELVTQCCYRLEGSLGPQSLCSRRRSRSGRGRRSALSSPEREPNSPDGDELIGDSIPPLGASGIYYITTGIVRLAGSRAVGLIGNARKLLARCNQTPPPDTCRRGFESRRGREKRFRPFRRERKQRGDTRARSKLSTHPRRLMQRRERVQGPGRIDQRRPRVDRDRNTERLDQLLAARPVAHGSVDVDGDAPFRPRALMDICSLRRRHR